MQSIAPRTTNAHDEEYNAYIQRIQARFTALTQDGKTPLLITDVNDGNHTRLFDAYLAAFPEAQRQEHNCSACRTFIRRFGSLVVADEDGNLKPAIWDVEDAPETYKASIEAMSALLRKSKVRGVFISDQHAWGQHEAGGWHHFAVTPPLQIVYQGKTKTAGQMRAQKVHEYRTLSRALSEFTVQTLETAVGLLKSDSLYRSEKVLGQAQWLHGLAVRKRDHKPRFSTVLWNAVALAPAGFCFPRSSMIGTLIEDIEKGLPFEQVSRSFKAKMDPLAYQRPQAAPKAGAIAQAEKIVEQMGIASAFKRRYARIDEVEALWRQPQEQAPASAGIFDHLKNDAAPSASKMVADGGPITFERFVRTVLEGAKKIEILIPSHGAFIATVTAEDPEAPPILQWDYPEKRNQFNWYFKGRGGSYAHNWGLTHGIWVNSPAVILRPHMWHSNKFSHQGKGAHFVIPGARDQQEGGTALFPEVLKSELHSVRSVIEAHSASDTLGGKMEASANGLDAVGAQVRVTPKAGPVIKYLIDRWE